jgi:hypothetical protein
MGDAGSVTFEGRFSFTRLGYVLGRIGVPLLLRHYQYIAQDNKRSFVGVSLSHFVGCSGCVDIEDMYI